MSPPELKLVKTGLSISDGQIVKSAPDGTVSARFPLDSVQSIRLVRRIDPTGIVFLLGGSILCALAYWMLPGPGFQWLGMVFGGALGMLGLLGLTAADIRIVTDEGAVDYNVLDTPAEAQSFAMTAALDCRTGTADAASDEQDFTPSVANTAAE